MFDSGVIADNLADNGTNASFGKMIACYGGNMTAFTTSARADITSGELKVMSQLKLGACISTVNNKTFLVRVVRVLYFPIISGDFLMRTTRTFLYNHANCLHASIIFFFRFNTKFLSVSKKLCTFAHFKEELLIK